MPRYFFHIDNGEFIPDPTGIELADMDAVRVEAVRAAGEMINDSRPKSRRHFQLALLR